MGAHGAFRMDARGAEFQLPGSARKVRMQFAGSAGGTVEPVKPLASQSHYLIGGDRTAWRTHVPHFGRVRYRNVYPGVDVVYYGVAGQIEYDLVVAPGASAERIKLKVSGADRLEVNDEGDLLVHTADGVIRQHRPRVYQGTERREIACRYRVRGSEVQFDLAGRDATRQMTIDPLLSYASFSGGSKTDAVYSIAADASGNSYLLMRTTSSDIPTTAQAYQKTSTSTSDLAIYKVDAKGALVWATYLGGRSNEIPAGIVVDKSGNVWVGGHTDSVDFPMTAKAYQGTNRGGYYGYDCFLAKLDPTGANLLYSTYLGGNNDELLMGMTIDAQGAVYADGFSASTNFPVTLSAYQRTNKFINVFVVKFTPDGALDFATFVGGNKSDVPGAISVDGAGNVYVVGDTASVDFPVTANAYQSNPRGGDTDVFLFKLNPQGTQLLYSTYLGAGGTETGYGVFADSSGAAYICGKTGSTGFPVTAGVLKSDLSGPSDAFVAKIDTVTGKLVYSTLLGGTREETATMIAADKNGNAYVAGYTTSTNFPVATPFQASHGGGYDGFVVKLDPAGAKVLDGSWIGGSGDESVMSMVFDGASTVYLSGDTDSSTDFPITKTTAFQKTFGGGVQDGWMAKVTFSTEQFNLTVTPDKLNSQATVKGPVQHLSLSIAGVTGVNAGWTAEAASIGGAWLTVNPKTGTGSAAIDVAVDPGSLAAGTYSGSVSIVNLVTQARTVVPVALTVSNPAGQLSPQNGLVNAASKAGGAIAPGEAIEIAGAGIGPDKLLKAEAGSDDLLPVLAGDTRVLFDGVAAPLLFVSATKVSALVPFELDGKEKTQIQVEYKGVKSNVLNAAVAACAPGIYTTDPAGTGPANALNEDGTVNSPANPAAKGSVITIFATGAGQTDPAGVNGKMARTEFPKPVLPVSFSFDGNDAEILFVGTVPNSPAGLLQVNARVAADAATGDLPVALKVGPCASQDGVTISVQ